MELERFPVSVGPEMNSLTEFLHQLHFRFLLTDYDYLLQEYHDINMMVPRPARFLFPVALLSVPAWWQTPCFQSEYPRGQLPWTDSHGIASGVPSLDSGWPTPSGRAISASGGSKEAAPGADTEIGLLVGATDPGFSTFARILQ